ncbi:hypothetical protein BVRB_1g022260, partial [Beta vulgaris subsp. vulgaris]
NVKNNDFGRSGPSDIPDTYSLLVLNITFRTSADRYGKVVDVIIPRDAELVNLGVLLLFVTSTKMRLRRLLKSLMAKLLMAER